MSLIQQALERASETVHTHVVDYPVKAKEIIQPKLASLQKEEQELKAVEKKINKLEKQTLQAPYLKWILLGFCLAGIVFGIWGMNLWTSGFNQRQETGVESLPISQSTSIISKIVPTPSRPSTPQFVLSGITLSGGVRYALVNNQVLMVGDMLKKENAVVREILARSVTLEQNGKLITLNMESPL